jgi:hypothetical protein
MDHICHVYLTQKQARARKVPYGSRCQAESTEFFEVDYSIRRPGEISKYARCKEHSKNLETGRGMGLPKGAVRRLTAEEYSTEIRTDGRTVWVDRIVTLARFCPVSGEIDGATPEMRPHVNMKPTWDDWHWFFARVKEVHGISIPDRFRPSYVTPASSEPAGA